MADQLIMRDMAADSSGRNLGRVAWLTSNRTALKGEYILARNDASAKLNPANPFAPTLTVVGAPDYGDAIFDGAKLSQHDWFDTNIRDAQELTMMVAYERLEGRSMLVGNFSGANTNTNVSLLLLESGLIGQAPGTTGAQATDSFVFEQVSGWTIAMLRTTGSTNFQIKVDAFRAGQRIAGTVKNTTATRYVDPAEATLAIGSARGSTGADSFNGIARYLFADIWHRCLSDAEALAVAQEWFAMGRACGQIV